MKASIVKFQQALEGNYALLSVISVKVNRSSVRIETAHDHALHACELLANRCGAKRTTTLHAGVKPVDVITGVLIFHF